MKSGEKKSATFFLIRLIFASEVMQISEINWGQFQDAICSIVRMSELVADELK